MTHEEINNEANVLLDKIIAAHPNADVDSIVGSFILYLAHGIRNLEENRKLNGEFKILGLPK